jgi:hypothetical protein
MTDDTDKELSPYLGGKHTQDPHTIAPSLSRDYHRLRADVVARLCVQLRSEVIYERYNAVFALSDFLEIDRAAAAVIRSVYDREIILVSLGAVFILATMETRILHPKLRAHSTRALKWALDNHSNIVIPYYIRDLRNGSSVRGLFARSVLNGLIKQIGNYPYEPLSLAGYTAYALRLVGTPEALAALNTWHSG